MFLFGNGAVIFYIVFTNNIIFINKTIIKNGYND